MSALITVRQATFWELVDASGSFRVHFSHKQEHHFVAAECSTFGIVTEHSVLLDYVHPWMAIYISSALKQPASVLEQMAAEVASIVAPWRGLSDYANNEAQPSSILEAGYGLLARCPEPIAAILGRTLKEYGVAHSVLPDQTSRWPMQAFVAGDNFVVAKQFRVEGIGLTTGSRADVPAFGGAAPLT